MTLIRNVPYNLFCTKYYVPLFIKTDVMILYVPFDRNYIFSIDIQA